MSPYIFCDGGSPSYERYQLWVCPACDITSYWETVEDNCPYCECPVDDPVIKAGNPPLATVSDDDLFAEVRRRGYHVS